MLSANGGCLLKFSSKPRVSGYGAVGCIEEKKGPLSNEFDEIVCDELVGKNNWEEAESELQRLALKCALEKCVIKPSTLDMVFAGDLLNQCVASNFAFANSTIPFVGVYGACSTMALSLILAAMTVDGGHAKNVAAVTSSHFAAAERQFRFPLEYGGQRPPTSQWTATASGAIILSNKGSKIAISKAILGRIVDLNITDANNMGAAMAPAAADTILGFLKATGASVSDYDMILTGDLGSIGSELLHTLLLGDGVDIAAKHSDCGLILYDKNSQDVHSGGSGCGCSAAVLCTTVLNSLNLGKISKILFCATGALLSSTTVGQGRSIPGIAHLVEIEALN